jgi:diguanylate cyclase (GGDEF)-like protein
MRGISSGAALAGAALTKENLGGDLRHSFSREVEIQRRVSIRQGLWVAVVIYLFFSVSDAFLIPDVAVNAIFARFVVGVFSLLLIEMLMRNDASASALDLTCAASIVFGYIAWLVPAMATSHGAAMSYYMIFGTIFMMGANLFFTFSFALSLTASTIVLVTYFIASRSFANDNDYQFTLGTFYLSCFIFTSYVNWRLNRERASVLENAMEARIQQQEAEERGRALLRLSNTDPLTGVENRRAVDQHLDELWADWSEFQINFAVFLIDVDFFKKYNDYYGHQQGDLCLVRVANAMENAAQAFNAKIGRYGGEEFIAAVRFKSIHDIEMIAEALRLAVEDLCISHAKRRDGSNKITVSIGVSYTRPHITAKLERLVNEADRALYGAKALGRNRVNLFDPDHPETGDENENIAALLNVAIEKHLVSLVYQPIKDLKSGKIESAEALLRLEQLDGINIPPSVFIPIAERTGAILDLGLWVIRTACQQLLVDKHIPLVSINVSPIQLQSPGFATSVAAILGQLGVSGKRLAFEITEGLEMDMNSDVLRCISHLKQLGIRIWLDDFGTGFAGLSWLRIIDFDTVKIDRSFLHDAETPRGNKMLEDIITLIRNRDHHILVEGVETGDQLDLLMEKGINMAQGYHIGRPICVDEFRQQFSNAKASKLNKN